MKITTIFIFFINIILSAQTNLTGVATHRSIGLYWTTSSGSSTNTAEVYYKKISESNWHRGHNLWFDSWEKREELAGGIYKKYLSKFPSKRKNEYRGSIVNLESGTNYLVEVRLKNGTIGKLEIKTWMEPKNLPILSTVYVKGNLNNQLNINTSGSTSGYIKYTHKPNSTSTIDVNNSYKNCININASYIIIDGLILKDAKINAIEIENGNHDIIITNCEITNWGREGKSKLGFGHDLDAAVYGKGKTIERITVQECKIHDPRYPGNAYDQNPGAPYDTTPPYHPSGPNAISMLYTAGNHVYRNNKIFAAWGHYFAYHFSGRENYSFNGAPNKDSDIYGNDLQNCWANSIEVDGGGQNIRIWENTFDNVKSGISTSPLSIGPTYIFRNIGKRSRHDALTENSDNYGRGNFIKTGGQKWGNTFYGGGKLYIYHNTVLQPPATNGSKGLGFNPAISGGGGNVYNVVSRNNIFLSAYSGNYIITDTDNDHVGNDREQKVVSSNTNDYDYDIYYGKIQPTRLDGLLHEKNGIKITNRNKMIFVNPTDNNYTLSSNSLGYEAGIRLFNFNDDYEGKAPDAGAILRKALKNDLSFSSYSSLLPPRDLASSVSESSIILEWDDPNKGNTLLKDGWSFDNNSDLTYWKETYPNTAKIYDKKLKIEDNGSGQWTSVTRIVKGLEVGAQYYFYDKIFKGTADLVGVFVKSENENNVYFDIKLDADGIIDTTFIATSTSIEIFLQIDNQQKGNYGYHDNVILKKINNQYDGYEIWLRKYNNSSAEEWTLLTREVNKFNTFYKKIPKEHEKYGFKIRYYKNNNIKTFTSFSDETIISANSYYTNSKIPIITTQPLSNAVKKNENVTFFVNANCTDEIGYQWWKEPFVSVQESKIVDNSKYSGSTTNKLTIKNVDKSDASISYICEVYNKTDRKNLSINSNLVSISIKNNNINNTSNIKVFLEGSYKKNGMLTTLNKKGLLPTIQPYNVSPFNYTGFQKVNSFAPNIVDWILVEIRNDKYTTVKKFVALLRNDGLLLNTLGKQNFSKEKIPDGNYHLVIYHRNHLPIMSSKKIMIKNSVINYNFTDSKDKVYGVNSTTKLSNGFWAMHSGNGDANKVINKLDYGTVANNILKTGYLQGDLNLDGIINVLDYSNINKNISVISNVP